VRTTYDRVFEFVVGEEGGYTADHRDPGNWTGGQVGAGELKGTKFGISAKAYPSLDIYNLTIEQAKEIYRKDYWTPMQLEGRPYGPALCLFDCAVNQGVSRARAILNKVATSSQPFIVAFQAERAVHYASLSTFKTFGLGWMRRLIRVSLEASKE